MLLPMPLIRYQIMLAGRQGGLKKNDMNDFLGPSRRAVYEPLHIIERMVICGHSDVQDNHD